MQVRNEERHIFKFLLQSNPTMHCAKIIADVQHSSRLNSWDYFLRPLFFLFTANNSIFNSTFIINSDKHTCTFVQYLDEQVNEFALEKIPLRLVNVDKPRIIAQSTVTHLTTNQLLNDCIWSTLDSLLNISRNKRIRSNCRLGAPSDSRYTAPPDTINTAQPLSAQFEIKRFLSSGNNLH